MNELIVKFLDTSDKPAFRGRLLAFEEAFAKTQELVPIDWFPTFHMFGEGTYIRQFCMPKGSAAFGKIHKHEHVAMVIQGDIVSVSEHGVERFKAPCCFVVPAGTKRFVYAHEDSIWVTVHHTHERDLAKIEQEIIAPSYESLGMDVLPYEGQLCLGE